MLLQSCPLEAAEADKPRGGTKRSAAVRKNKLVRNMVEESLARGFWPKASVTRPVRAPTNDRRVVEVSAFVLSREGKPVMPCSQKRARKLLEAGRARVHRLHPFTIRIVDRSFGSCELQPLRLSLDPGSKVTGLAIARVAPQVGANTAEPGTAPVVHICFLMELVRRGHAIRDGLQRRAAFRRGRRSRNHNPAELYRPGPRVDGMQIVQCVGCGMKINVIDPEADRGGGNTAIGQVLEVPRGYEPPRVSLWRRIAGRLQRRRRA